MADKNSSALSQDQEKSRHDGFVDIVFTSIETDGSSDTVSVADFKLIKDGQEESGWVSFKGNISKLNPWTYEYTVPYSFRICNSSSNCPKLECTLENGQGRFIDVLDKIRSARSTSQETYSVEYEPVGATEASDNYPEQIIFKTYCKDLFYTWQRFLTFDIIDADMKIHRGECCFATGVKKGHDIDSADHHKRKSDWYFEWVTIDNKTHLSIEKPRLHSMDSEYFNYQTGQAEPLRDILERIVVRFDKKIEERYDKENINTCDQMDLDERICPLKYGLMSWAVGYLNESPIPSQDSLKEEPSTTDTAKQSVWQELGDQIKNWFRTRF